MVGAGSHGPLLRLLRPSVARYCLAHAACPVLTVPPSPLQGRYAAARRRNAWRRPLDLRELARCEGPVPLGRSDAAREA
ncbi:universal stress protein [Streptomyces sp. NPDC101206]|uniref:universal stress protein n=1 Tax=Streptomyces sp. NPDC101206 TaxID=3366128 RepID=UPI00381E15E6